MTSDFVRFVLRDANKIASPSKDNTKKEEKYLSKLEKTLATIKRFEDFIEEAARNIKSENIDYIEDFANLLEELFVDISSSCINEDLCRINLDELNQQYEDCSNDASEQRIISIKNKYWQTILKFKEKMNNLYEKTKELSNERLNESIQELAQK